MSIDHTKWEFENMWRLHKSCVDVIDASENLNLRSEKFSIDEIPEMKYELLLKKSDGDRAVLFLIVDRKPLVQIKVCYNVILYNTNRVWVDMQYICGDNFEKAGNCIVLSEHGFNSSLFNTAGDFVIGISGYFQILSSPTCNPTPKSLAASLWKRDDEKDVKIVVGGETLKVHGWILAVNSSVFDAVLSSGVWKEVKEKEYAIKDFPTHVVKDALEFFYQRDIKENLIANKDSIEKYIAFCDKYDMKQLMDYVQLFCIDICASDETICGFLNMALKYNAKMLYEFGMLVLLDGWNVKAFKNRESLDEEIIMDFANRCLSPVTCRSLSSKFE